MYLFQDIYCIWTVKNCIEFLNSGSELQHTELEHYSELSAMI